jgi:hypothetical protein
VRSGEGGFYIRLHNVKQVHFTTQIHIKHAFTILTILLKYLQIVGFEDFTAVTMMNAVFWDVTPYRPCKNRRFRGMCRLHLQGRKNPQAKSSASSWLADNYLPHSHLTKHIGSMSVFVSDGRRRENALLRTDEHRGIFTFLHNLRSFIATVTQNYVVT